MLNLSEAAVSKRMKKIGDRVTVRVNGDRREINVAEYRAAVGATVDMIRQRAQGVDIDVLPGEDLFRPPAPPALPAAPAPAVSLVPDGPVLAAEQARRVKAQADLAELELQERRGHVLQTAAVVNAMTTCAEAMTRRINQLPQRAGDIAVAMQEGGEQAVRALLKRLTREWLAGLADDMRLIENQAPDTDPDDE